MIDTSDTFLQKLSQTVTRHTMIAEGDTVLVAVSGGADSVALLLALHYLGYGVAAAHFDHQTREGQSTKDARFVRDLAQSLEIPFHRATRPVTEEARVEGRSFEDFAREVRYDFLIHTAVKRGCTVIATGHHADDQAETVLMRVLRGTSPKGLAGIPPVREMDGVSIVRPLLEHTKGEITDWLQTQHQPWREDHTNTDTQYHRNDIRHTLMPLLRDHYNPRIQEVLCRLAAVQQGENDLLDQLTRDLLAQCLRNNVLDRASFTEAPVALQQRALASLAQQLGIDIPFTRVLEAVRFVQASPTGKFFDLGNHVSLYSGKEEIHFQTDTPSEQLDEMVLAVPGITDAFGKRYIVQLLPTLPEEPLKDYCTPTRQVFDADTVGENLLVRFRKEGDRFTPFGMTGTRKLKDYFIDRGIPAPQRDHQPLIVAEDQIAWVVGHATSAHAAVTPNTTSWLEIEVHDAAV